MEFYTSLGLGFGAIGLAGLLVLCIGLRKALAGLRKRVEQSFEWRDKSFGELKWQHRDMERYLGVTHKESSSSGYEEYRKP